jgi:hypothetical protein
MGGEKKVHTGLYWVHLKARDHLKNLGEDEKIILKRIFKDECGPN